MLWVHLGGRHILPGCHAPEELQRTLRPGTDCTALPCISGWHHFGILRLVQDLIFSALVMTC